MCPRTSYHICFSLPWQIDEDSMLDLLVEMITPNFPVGRYLTTPMGFNDFEAIELNIDL